MRKFLCAIISLLGISGVHSQSISPAGPINLCPATSQLLTVSGVTGSPTYQWQLNSTNIGGATFISYSAVAAGNYTVILTVGVVNDTLGPVQFIGRPNPVAAFTFAPNNQCGNVPVAFTNTSSGTGLSYSWNFGDPNSGANNISTQAQPTHQFIGNPGNGVQSFTASLTVTSVYGCTATTTATVTVKQVPDLTLGGPGATVYNGKKYFRKCSNAGTAQFDFTNQSTTQSTNTFYQIVFGDGSPDYTSATFPSPVAHNYSIGTDTLLFIVTGLNGCKDTAVYYVFVGSNPAVGLGNPGNTAICTSSILTFPISSTATNPPGTSYSVVFNDGTPAITFSHPAPADISHNFQTTSCGTNSGTYPNSFSATIQATNPCATSSATVVPIYVSQRPNASFVISPRDTVCVNAITSFTNTSGVSNDIDNGACVPAKFVWTVTPSTGWVVSGGMLGNDFGLIDPTTWQTGTNVFSLSFTTVGTYTIKLKLGNSTCGSDSIVKTICVNPIPTGSFTVNQNIGCAPLSVNTNAVSNAAICGSNRFFWSITYAATSGCLPASGNFIYLNGTGNSSAQPQFQFINPGIYTISMVVISPAASCTSSVVTQIITVKGKPVATLNSVPSTLCQSLSISPQSTVTCYTTANTYAWIFSGGTPATSVSANPGSISYNTPGNYNVTLGVTNECGTTTVTSPITIKETPVPVVPSNVTVCAGTSLGPLSFSSSTAGATFTWTNSNTSIGLGASGSTNPIPAFITLNATSLPVVSTITVTASLNGCSSTKTFSITVNPKPLAPLATTPVNYCQNAPAVPLTATATSGNTLLWYTVPSGGTGVSIAPTPITTAIGNTIYYVSQVNTATGCEGPRTAITVIVKASPVISAANSINPTNCGALNGSIILNGLVPNTTYSVTYLKNGVPVTINLTSNTSGVITITNLGAGTYTNIKVTILGCSSNEVGPFTLSDPSAPITPTVNSNAPLCAGSMLTLSASTSSPGVATYTWTGPNGFSSSQQNPAILNVTTAASGTYNVTVTINGCISPLSSLSVTIHPTPLLPTIGNNGPLCGGVGINLNLSSSTTFLGAVTYNWTGPNTFSSNTQNPVIAGATVSDAGVYSVIITANTGNCLSPVANTNVIIKPTPVITDSSFIHPANCGSNTGSISLLGLLVNTTYTINYIKNSTPVSVTLITNAAGTITISGLSAGVYSNIVVVLNGCPSRVVGPITLSDPNPPAMPTALGNGPLCSGNILSLQTAAVAGATYQWTGPNGFSSILQNPTIPNATTASSGNYSLSITVSNCISPAGTVNVIVNQTPATPVAGSNSPICGNVGAALNLTASTSTTGTISYNWTGPNSFNSSAQNPSIPNVTTMMNGLYSVTATGTPGNCVSAAAQVFVTVNPTPVIASTTLTHPLSCGSSTGSFSVYGLAANQSFTVNYTWNSVPQTSTVTSGPTGILTVSNLVQGIYDGITVVLNGCPSAAVGPITLSDPNPPAMPTTSSNGPLCSGNTLNLQTATIPGATYQWTGPNGFSSNNQNPTILNATTLESGNYTLAITVSNCVSPAATLPVIIHPLPAAPLTVPVVNYCINAVAIPLVATALPSHTLSWYITATGGTGNASAPIPSTVAAGTVNYYVSQVNNTTSCEGGRAAIQVITNPDAIALFIPTDTIKCPPFNINTSVIGLQTYPANNGNYEWYVNNVLIGTGAVFPGYSIVNEDDSVTVKLKTISAFGCKPDSMERKFYTFKLPHPSFTLSDTVACGPVTVLISNTTPNISLFSYTWNFGNGQTSNLAQPGNIVFQPNPNSGDTTYIVSLKILSICDTITITKSIRVKAKPKALFTPSITSGCSPMRVTFYNTSKGVGNTYYWDFGDGTTATSSNNNPIQHTYTTGVQDTFYIKLIAVNECGSDSITYSVIAAPNNVYLNFAVNGPNNFGCAPHTVAFINNTPGASSFNWNFGDGNTLNTTASADTIYHTYLLAGNYTVTLTAQNSCTDTSATRLIRVFAKPNAAFIADRYITCIGDNIQFTNQTDSATSYQWSFGDGSTSTLLNPLHSYVAPGIYTVKLIAYRVNAPGNVCTDTITRQIQVVASMPGWFTMSDTAGLCAPFTVTFVNQNRPSVSAIWNFGDGNTGTGDSVVHTYAIAGVYNITLTVIVPGGCTYNTQRRLTVSGPSGTFQYAGGFVCYPNPVRFEATVVNSSMLVWNFGDGNTLSTSQQVVYHNYTNPGIYAPSLTLQNGAGCNYYIPGTDSIKVDKIVAEFTATQQKYCGYTNLVLRDTSSVYFGKSLVEWDFGDGTNGQGINVMHTYTTTGTYNIRMIVIGISGCRDTVNKPIDIIVNKRPISSISADSINCTGNPVLFTSTAQSVDPINLLQWTISNGYASSGQMMTYSFNNPGTYSVRLIAGTVNGCYDTSYHNIRINPSPVVNASSSVRICLGNSVTLNVTGAANYQWSPIQGLSCTRCASTVASPVVTTPYIVTGTNIYGCSAKDTVIVTVIQPLNMQVSGNDTMCIGKSVNLMASGAASYAWTPAQGLSSSTSPTPTASPSVTTTYRVVGYDGFNCFTDTAFIVVAVGKYPIVNLGPDLHLSTGTQQPLATTVTNGPIRDWLWTPATDLNCSNCPLPVAYIKDNISYIVNVTTHYGCKASDTINIKVFCTDAQVFIPNAFSPDGDGVNDILMVRGKGIASVKTFRIFNRWGELVFERSNFPPNNSAYGWNGKIRGVQGPPDVFVYTVEVICDNGTPYTYKGNTSIIK